MQARCNNHIREVCKLVTKTEVRKQGESRKESNKVSHHIIREESDQGQELWTSKNLERVQIILRDKCQVLIEISEGWNPFRWLPGPVIQPKFDLKDNLPHCCHREEGQMEAFIILWTRNQVDLAWVKPHFPLHFITEVLFHVENSFRIEKRLIPPRVISLPGLPETEGLPSSTDPQL